MKAVWAERLGIGVASLALAIVLIALVSGYFAGRDTAAVSGGLELGHQYRDLGDATLPPGAPRPTYDSDPPTSGPHARVPVLANGLVLSDDQILTALGSGDIVVLYGSRRPPAGLRALARELSGPFSPALAEAGQAVVFGRRFATQGLIGLAWTRIVRVSAPSDSLLRQFAQEWLGRGARGG